MDEAGPIIKRETAPHRPLPLHRRLAWLPATSVAARNPAARTPNDGDSHPTNRWWWCRDAHVKTLAPKLIADWQDVPAMADVVKQAKEMLGEVEGK